MEPLQQLGLAMGTAWTSGINLYATVAALGSLRRPAWCSYRRASRSWRTPR